MNTHIWRKLWAFLNQPLFKQHSAEVQPDLQRLEHYQNIPYIQAIETDLQLLEYCWTIPSTQDVETDQQLLERCWNKPCIQPKYDR